MVFVRLSTKHKHLIMSKKHQRTITFPVEWDQITKLESVLLHEFIDNPTKRNGINLLMITLGSRFGLRVSDLLSIRWDHIIEIEPDQTFTLIEKKTKKIRQIKMTKKVKTILNQVSPICHRESISNNILFLQSDYEN